MSIDLYKHAYSALIDAKEPLAILPFLVTGLVVSSRVKMALSMLLPANGLKKEKKCLRVVA
ncbi:hypothetical protein NHP214376_06000 [Helicobacter ailurogastricus]|nr:hypothetical protein NHP214376_06000 [Helicobacter ailurogastricus]GLH58955.1 hypothetical protein NHP214377_02190 [Helicobacter ailurogastricus]